MFFTVFLICITIISFVLTSVNICFLVTIGLQHCFALFLNTNHDLSRIVSCFCWLNFFFFFSLADRSTMSTNSQTKKKDWFYLIRSQLCSKLIFITTQLLSQWRLLSSQLVLYYYLNYSHLSQPMKKELKLVC